MSALITKETHNKVKPKALLNCKMNEKQHKI